MTVCSWYDIVPAYTGQVTFWKVTENTWPCKAGHLVWNCSDLNALGEDVNIQHGNRFTVNETEINSYSTKMFLSIDVR